MSCSKRVKKQREEAPPEDKALPLEGVKLQCERLRSNVWQKSQPVYGDDLAAIIWSLADAVQKELLLFGASFNQLARQVNDMRQRVDNIEKGGPR